MRGEVRGDGRNDSTRLPHPPWNFRMGMNIVQSQLSHSCHHASVELTRPSRKIMWTLVVADSAKRTPLRSFDVLSAKTALLCFSYTLIWVFLIPQSIQLPRQTSSASVGIGVSWDIQKPSHCCSHSFRCRPLSATSREEDEISGERIGSAKIRRNSRLPTPPHLTQGFLALELKAEEGECGSMQRNPVDRRTIDFIF